MIKHLNLADNRNFTRFRKVSEYSGWFSPILHVCLIISNDDLNYEKRVPDLIHRISSCLYFWRSRVVLVCYTNHYFFSMWICIIYFKSRYHITINQVINTSILYSFRKVDCFDPRRRVLNKLYNLYFIQLEFLIVQCYYYSINIIIFILNSNRGRTKSNWKCN